MAMRFVERRLVRNFLNLKLNHNALLWSLIALASCFLMSQLYWHNPVGEYLAANPKLVFEQGEYWRLFTSSFIHGDLAHFLSNSIMLTIMGYFVSYHYGTLMYPMLGFVAGILINFLVLLTHPPHVSLVGASGIVYYLWGFWLILYLMIQRHIPLHRRLMKITAVGIIVLVPTEFRPQVSYLAHGVGLGLGILFGFTYYLFNYKKIRSHEVWEDIYEEIEEEDLEGPYYYLH